MFKKLLIVFFIILVGMQFYNPNDNSDNSVSESDFISSTMPPDEIKNIFQNSCYDCHSNFTKYPWYSNIAPISYLINNHIEEGKSELNFSEWTNYSLEKKIHKLDEMIDEISENEMPLTSYKWIHESAQLLPIQKEAITHWLKQIKSILEVEETIREEEKPEIP